MKQICSKCHSALDDDAEFCTSCGNPITKIFNCPGCGGTVEPTAKFCKYCAFDLSAFIYKNPSVATTESGGYNPASLISPSGAAFVIICFFLPWMSFCNKSVTGAELAGGWTALWLIPVMSITAFAAYFIFKFQNRLYRARPFIIGSSIIALGILIFLSRWGIVEFFSGNFEVLNILKYGSYGTVMGFILTIAGCFFITRNVIKNKLDKPDDEDGLQ